MPRRAARAVIIIFFISVLVLAFTNIAVTFIPRKAGIPADREITMRYWESIIEDYPTYGIAYRELAREQYELGHFEQAESSEARAEVLGASKGD